MQKLQKMINKLSVIFTEKPNIKILKKWGLTVGENLNIQNGVMIDNSHCWLISIGDNVTLAPRVHILAHDASTKNFIGYTKIGGVTIGNNVFIGANTTILPNVKIGDNVIVGANTLVSKDIHSNTVVAGNPAKVISDLESYLDKYNNISEELIFDESYTIRKNIDNIKKKKMKEKIKDNIGLVK